MKKIYCDIPIVECFPKLAGFYISLLFFEVFLMSGRLSNICICDVDDKICIGNKLTVAYSSTLFISSLH